MLRPESPEKTGQKQQTWGVETCLHTHTRKTRYFPVFTRQQVACWSGDRTERGEEEETELVIRGVENSQGLVEQGRTEKRMMAGRERRDLRCQMHRRRRRWARNSGEKALVFSPARLMSRNRPGGRKKGREHEVGSETGSRGKWETGTERRLGLAGRAGAGGPSRRRRLPLPSRFHRPRAPGAPPAARASWGTPGPRASARRGAVDRALPARCGVEWRRASDRIRLGRPGARRGGAE